jgi:hypothetical protein
MSDLGLYKKLSLNEPDYYQQKKGAARPLPPTF